jgi:hypothetical protein
MEQVCIQILYDNVDNIWSSDVFIPFTFAVKMQVYLASAEPDISEYADFRISGLVKPSPVLINI